MTRTLLPTKSFPSLRTREASEDNAQSLPSIYTPPARASDGANLLSVPVQRKPAQTGLPEGLKAGLQQMSNMDLSGVRVHYNSTKPARLQAHAHTQGLDIHLAPGQERYLPHEGWHVVQQLQGRVRPTASLGGVAINDSRELEHEANVMGARAFSMRDNVIQRAGKNPCECLKDACSTEQATATNTASKNTSETVKAELSNKPNITINTQDQDNPATHPTENILKTDARTELKWLKQDIGNKEMKRGKPYLPHFWKEIEEIDRWVDWNDMFGDIQPNDFERELQKKVAFVKVRLSRTG